MRKKIKYILINISEILLHIFWIFPIKKRIFFISHNGTQYSCNPKYIYEYINYKLLLNYDYIWCLNNNTLNENNIEIVKYKSLKYYYLILTSKIIISNDLISSNLPLRKSQKYIETWHGGGAYKKTGKDVYSSKYEKLQVKKISNKMTYFISSSSFVTKTKSEGYNIDRNKMLEIGMPRNDIFFKANDDIKDKVHKYFNIPQNVKLVLYAPTFRRYSSYNPLSELNIPNVLFNLNEKFNEKWCLVYRLHRLLDNENINIKNVYDANDYPDVQELLVASDILITDFSSIMWDFSLQYKPIFCFVPDILNFKSEDFFTQPEEWPGLLAYSNEMLIKQIINFKEQIYLDKVKRHHQKHNSFENGTATEKISELVIKYMDE